MEIRHHIGMIHLTQSPTDPAFVQNPYPFYAVARDKGDLFYWRDYGHLAAASHRAVSLILRDRRFGREIPPELATTPPAHLAPFYDIEAHSMLELEPPRHTRLRGLVMRAFTSRNVTNLRPAIAQLCDDLIDAFPAGPFDLLDHFARPLPVIVIARLLGVDPARAPDLLAWSNAMVAMYTAARTRKIEDTAVQATLAFRAYLEDEISQRRAQPDDGLLSTLIAAEQDGARLSHDELVTTAILLLNAGHEATVHTLGNAVKTILQTNAPLTDGTVEEALRFDPPLHLFTRYAYEDMTLFDTPIKRGDTIACLLASANRDHAIWPNPDQFDPTRAVKPNTSFGAGLHFCVGAPLARLELDIALRSLFTRCPDLTLTAPPQYADIYHFHGLTELMVQRSL